MQRVILRYGLIGAVFFVLFMPAEMHYIDSLGHDWGGALVGYLSMVVAFLMVFFGVRSYRDHEANGTLSFGKAFQIGILITLVVSVGYVATWEVIFYNFMPDFAEKYGKVAVESARAAGKTAAEIESTRQAMAAWAIQYKNPLYNCAQTFIEIFPVGLVMTLITAAMLRTKSKGAKPQLSSAAQVS